MSFLVQGGKVAQTALSAKELLLESRGSYTTARTYGRTRVFRLEQHLSRLVDSARSLGCAENLIARIATQTRDCMRIGADAVAGESRLTVLCTWDSSLSVQCLAEPLPPLPKQPVSVVIRSAQRQDPTTKDSQYVADRQKLDAIKGYCHETLLSDGNDVLEGTRCNFYAIYRGNILRTAPVGQVLGGTVRAVVLDCCRREGFTVDETPPLISDLHLWEAAMISSTSQLLTPVDEVVVPSTHGAPVNRDDDLKRWQSTHCMMENRLCELVLAAVADESSLI